jgi:outer membrane cobalamin receptor
VSGTVVNAKTKEPVPYAAVLLGGGERWTVSGEKGAFVLKNVPEGEVTLTVSCLGYVKQTVKLTLTADVPALHVALAEDNLQLSEVVVSARPAQEATSSYVIDRASLEHLQMLNVSDAMSLLPGGQTNRNLHLATSGAHYLAVRSNMGSEDGNPTFGTAVEVDGVRLSNNAAFGASAASRLYGVDTRTIASSNVESVEVVTGMPSVQYGDLSNGMVKINTVRGASPLHVEASTRPNTKQVAANKGFSLGRGAGVLNAGLEHTLSVSDLASPYTSYARNGLSLRYSNTFNRQSGKPLTLEAGLTGNVGGYHSKGDPDAFVDTYTKMRGNTLRGNVRLSWLPDRSWLTNLEGTASIHYSDNLAEARLNRSSSASIAAIHGQEEGYFVATRYDENPTAPIVIIPPGYWYQTEFTDSKPLTLSASLKGNWARRFGRIRNNVLAGVDFTSAGNRGRGVYYDDLRYAPTGWREYRFDRVPFMNNLAWYVEDKVQLPVGATRLQVVAGLRSDVTFVEASRYGTVNSFSPRFSARWTFVEQPEAPLSRLTLTGGWGKAVKLPSFEVLYPRPSYSDRLAFAPGAMADGTTFYAYHIMPHTPEYNPNLRWQQSRQWEAGVEAKFRSVYISLSFFRHQTIDPYIQIDEYTPFAYKMTGQSALEGSAIASVNRIYSIDRETGIVTVTDRTGTHAPEVLAYSERRTFKSSYTYANGTPFVRRGVEWVVDFGKIPFLQTSVRFDGNYYHYRSTEETVMPWSPTSQIMQDGNPYKYVGYYVGGSASRNGYETKNVNANLWLTTHIPALRLILSLRLEASLYNYTQNLSEYRDGERGFAVDSRGSNVPAADPARYNTNRYVALYPLYYTTCEDMETKIPFAETFAWAKDNDQPLYNALASLVQRTNTDYYFNADRLSMYYVLHLSVTKEIGDIASLSFSATNFTNNAQLVTSSANNSQASLYNSSRIPRFYYSLSLKIKL